MDRNIAKHLAKRGMHSTKPQKKDIPFSERNPDFFKWFKESVMGFDSEEYHREFWREARRTGHTIGKVPYGLKEYHRRRNSRFIGAAIAFELLLGGGALAVWLIRRMIDQHIQRLRRPTYYETERARRQALADERRRIRRRRTLNACPSKEMLIEAFRNARNSSEDMIRFGSLVEDLECYVDNTPYFANGCLVGRRGGIKRHFEREIPELYAHYKTVMRYKALSKKFRQAVGVGDPVPADMLLAKNGKIPENTAIAKDVQNQVQRDFSSEINYGKKGRAEVNGTVKGDGENQDTRDFSSDGNATGVNENYAENAEGAGAENAEGAGGALMAATERTRALAAKILAGCEGTVVSLAAQLEARLNPDYAPRIKDIKSHQVDTNQAILHA